MFHDLERTQGGGRYSNEPNTPSRGPIRAPSPNAHRCGLELYERRPDEFQGWLRNMVLFEPDTQLYLLDLTGTVLACSGAPLPPMSVCTQPGDSATHTAPG